MNTFLDNVQFDELPKIPEFVAALQTTERSTHVESKEDVGKALFKRHKEMFEADRGVYTLLLALSGAETNIEIGSALLLGNPLKGLNMPKDVETIILRQLIDSLKTPRRFRLFVRLAESKVNNNRTRKIVLRSILQSEKLELWAVKYRKKLAYILNHFVGMDQIGIVKAIAKEWVQDGQVSVANNGVLKKLLFVDEVPLEIHEAIAFIFGIKGRFYRSEMFVAFFEARHDLEKGKCLPPEVLEGIRSTYHPNTPAAKAVKLTKDSMTAEQTVRRQRTLAKAGVQVEAQYSALKMHELFKLLYQLEEDGKQESEEVVKIIDELANKARKVANTLSFNFVQAGILVDNSFSGIGDQGSAKRDPISKILSMFQVLRTYFDRHIVAKVTDGNNQIGLPVLAGQTDLATPFLKLVEAGCDGIFILSDGRDNAPAGRLFEVIQHLEKMKELPTVIHFNPVTGGESLVKVSPTVPTFGLAKAEGIQGVVFSGMLEQNPKIALEEMYFKYALLTEGV